MAEHDFDPDHDFPPTGALADFDGNTFEYAENSVDGWWSLDRRLFAHPFSASGQELARRWVVQGQRMKAGA